MKAFKPATPAHALIAAIHAVRPPVLANGLVVDMEKPHHLETVNITFALTPELVKAWGDECAKLGVEPALPQGMDQGPCALLGQLEAMEHRLTAALAQIAKNTATSVRSLEASEVMHGG